MTSVQQASLFLAAARWCSLVGFESTRVVQEREEAYQALRRIVLEIDRDDAVTQVFAPAEMDSQKRNR